MGRVTLLVCGEPMRGDDALALSVLDALAPDARALAEVRHVGQLMPDDLEQAGPVIVLDAVEGREPGDIVDLPLERLAEATTAGNLSPASSHALPLPITLGVVERLAGRLPDGRFVGIGAANYELGAGLTPAVRDAIGPCAARVSDWITILASPGAQIPCA
jgi:hydrogenase maturation protease